MNSLYTKCDRVIEILKNNNDMKHKVCLLFTFLSLSVSGISATNGQDSIRQIQLSDLEVQIRWVNPTAIRAYLDDTKPALGGKLPRFTKNYPVWKHFYPVCGRPSPIRFPATRSTK